MAGKVNSRRARMRSAARLSWRVGVGRCCGSRIDRRTPVGVAFPGRDLVARAVPLGVVFVAGVLALECLAQWVALSVVAWMDFARLVGVGPADLRAAVRRGEGAWRAAG